MSTLQVTPNHGRFFFTVSLEMQISIAIIFFPIHFAQSCFKLFLPSGDHGTAGMKVLILPKTDVPLVKSFGIAVPPGMHALIGMELTEVIPLYFFTLKGRNAN